MKALQAYQDSKSSLFKDDVKAIQQRKTSHENKEAQPKQTLSVDPKRFKKRRDLSISNFSRVNQTFENQTEENSLALKLKCDKRYTRIRDKQKEFKSVVAELLRLELLKTGIKREEISKL